MRKSDNTVEPKASTDYTRKMDNVKKMLKELKIKYNLSK